jgi:hypothetical protein
MANHREPVGEREDVLAGSKVHVIRMMAMVTARIRKVDLRTSRRLETTVPRRTHHGETVMEKANSI